MDQANINTELLMRQSLRKAEDRKSELTKQRKQSVQIVKIFFDPVITIYASFAGNNFILIYSSKI